MLHDVRLHSDANVPLTLDLYAKGLYQGSMTTNASGDAFFGVNRMQGPITTEIRVAGSKPANYTLDISSIPY